MVDIGSVSGAGTYTVAFTPVGFVSKLFGQWRGDIIYRFKVICTKYHKGRLRVTWDPVSNIGATTDYTHIAFTKIIDLSESDEVEFRVPYMQALQWAKVTSPLVNIWSTSTYNTTTPNEHNGTLTVRVLTNLSAPIDTAPVSIFVFVRGAENLEFANPIDDNQTLSMFDMQAGEGEFNSQPDPNQYLINWGEAIPSLRLLLRRSVFYDRQNFTQTASDRFGYGQMIQSRFPAAPGYDTTGKFTAKGVETPGTTYNYNYCVLTPMAYLAPAFVACRGGIRWHYNVDTAGAPVCTELTVTRMVALTATTRLTYLGLDAAGLSASQKAYNQIYYPSVSHGMSGVVATNCLTQTGQSVEMPMMVPNKFVSTFPAYWQGGATLDGTNVDKYKVRINVHPFSSDSGSLDTVYLTRWVSAGTDFNVHFFLRCPMMTMNDNMGRTPV
jgi:hypothetical protein